MIDDVEKAFDEHSEAVLRRARVLARNGNEHDAQAVVSDVFMDLIRRVKSDEFDEIRDLRSWLMTVTYRKSVDLSRRRVSGERKSELLRQQPPAIRASEAERAVERERIRRALAELPAEDVGLLLDQQDGLSHAELADVHAMTVNAVRSRLHRTKAKLRALLSDSEST